MSPATAPPRAGEYRSGSAFASQILAFLRFADRLQETAGGRKKPGRVGLGPCCIRGNGQSLTGEFDVGSSRSPRNRQVATIRIRLDQPSTVQPRGDVGRISKENRRVSG